MKCSERIKSDHARNNRPRERTDDEDEEFPSLPLDLDIYIYLSSLREYDLASLLSSKKLHPTNQSQPTNYQIPNSIKIKSLDSQVLDKTKQNTSIHPIKIK